MSKTVYYRQCHLVKPIARGESHQTSWLPETFAVLGKVLKLRGADGAWDNGWVVRRVGSYRAPDDSVPDAHKDIKGHRRATGDALPKEKA